MDGNRSIDHPNPPVVAVEAENLEEVEYDSDIEIIEPPPRPAPLIITIEDSDEEAAGDEPDIVVLGEGEEDSDVEIIDPPPRPAPLIITIEDSDEEAAGDEPNNVVFGPPTLFDYLKSKYP